MISKELIVFRQANLGWEATVSRKYKDDYGYGVSISWSPITAPNSGAARQKSQGNDGNDITYDVTAETAVTLTINQHWYSAFELEEFENALSIHDLKAEYLKAAAYVVNLAVDDSLAGLPDNFSQAVGTLTADPTDDDIRRCIQYLEDANAPMEDRFGAVSPATKMALMGIDRYASSEFNRGEGANLVTGAFSGLYGLTWWQSTNIEGTNAAGHDCAVYQADAIALAMRMSPKVHNFEDIQNLSEQSAISVIYGLVEVRDDHGVWLKAA
jgi:hypothetical protein